MEFRLRSEQQITWVRAELVPRREADGSVVWSGFWVDASVERARSEELARARDMAEAAFACERQLLRDDEPRNPHADERRAGSRRGVGAHAA
jgi:hypothetical protein